MTLSEKTKKAIEDEYKAFTKKFYAHYSNDERPTLRNSYSTPKMSIFMIEQLLSFDDDIIDPCAGAGMILAACIIAGADPNHIFAVEYDLRTYKELLVPHLTGLGVPTKNIRLGDSSDVNAYNFNKRYSLQRYAKYKSLIWK